MNDIYIRAAKTFIQAFFGVFVPELCVFLQSDFPLDVNAAAMVFSSMLCASLAAGISAVWNYLETVLGNSVQKKCIQDEPFLGEFDE